MDVAEVAFWNVALETAEIKELARGASPLSIRRNSLVFYAPLLGGPTDIDLIGGKSLTLNGGPGIDAHPIISPYHSAFANVRNQLYVAPVGGSLVWSPMRGPLQPVGYVS